MRQRAAGHIKIIFVLLTLGLFGFTCNKASESGLPVAELSIKGHKILAEIADKPATRTAGLMFRKQLATDGGMLFVFPDNAPRSFWMKNTYIPLGIAFLDEKGVILNILEMPPQTEKNFFSKGLAKFALEANSGWFEKRGIKAGDLVEGVANVPAPKD
jgi:uncharacterized membrane protein (UPF0127 family)